MGWSYVPGPNIALALREGRSTGAGSSGHEQPVSGPLAARLYVQGATTADR